MKEGGRGREGGREGGGRVIKGRNLAPVNTVLFVWVSLLSPHHLLPYSVPSFSPLESGGPPRSLVVVHSHTWNGEI